MDDRAARLSAAPSRPVAVIGGGWAGCAAAVTLAAAGVPVTLFEQAKVLGGRARRVVLDGAVVDNGQHLLLGAYAQTLALLTTVHGAGALPALLTRLPLTLRPFGRQLAAPALTAWRLPAPLHLALGIAGARGLSATEKFALAGAFRALQRSGFRCPPAQTVAQCFAGGPLRLMAAFWEPLCLAALNTPPDAASAQVFANVLRAAFAGTSAASDFLIPAVDLTTLFPEAAARYVAGRGGSIARGTTARIVGRDGAGLVVRTAKGDARYAAVVVATAPQHAAAAVAVAAPAFPVWRQTLAPTAALTYESITTLYFGFAEDVALPAPILRLDDAPGQWLFDRSGVLPRAAPAGARGLVSVVISAGGPHDDLAHPALVATVEAQLRRLEPSLPPCVWSRVVAERRATYACRPGLARPAAGRLDAGVYLAGDWTDPDFPATLEAATRSGVAAAEALLADRGR
jgi:squalene-associated FAD-dependent desaturase